MPTTGREDASIEALIAAGDHEAAATAALRVHGPEIMGFLVGVMGDPVAASEVFSQFAEDLWRGLPGFQGRSSARTWLYCVARNARARYYRDPFYRRGRRLMTTELSKLAQRVTTGYVDKARLEDRAQRLRRQLSPDERELLTLRLDREMSWDEVAEVVGASAAAVRKRYERLRRRLRSLMDTDRE